MDRSVLLWPLIPKISYKQLTRPPRAGSRVNEPETAEETGFDILLTLKMKAKRASSKGPFRFWPNPGLWKSVLRCFTKPRVKPEGPGSGHYRLLAACFFLKQLSSKLFCAGLLSAAVVCSPRPHNLTGVGDSSGRRQECEGCGFRPSPQDPGSLSACSRSIQRGVRHTRRSR